MNNKEEQYTHVQHDFGPVYNKESRILILGSFPSVKSRENQFYYGHPQNRFWKVLSKILNEDKVPLTIEEKKQMLLKNRIAIWDVIQCCDIIGSSDSSIKNVTANNIAELIAGTDIHKIYANGNKAYELFNKYCKDTESAYVLQSGNRQVNIQIEKLPSTSPANAAFSLDRLTDIWESIVSYL